MAAGLAERERIRAIFGTYVDRDVAEHILSHGPSLEGEEVDVTVMFIDVRGFTAYAERSAATDVVATLNRLFATIVPLIEQHGGHVDKFVGDGLLAVFGAPVRHDDHADRALEAALAIAGAIADRADDVLQIGIGLNSGRVVAGNIGSPERVEFSVIGDPVNVAARVEAATRDTDDQILISEDVRRRLRRCHIEFDQRPDVTLKGKRAPVTLFAPRLDTSSGPIERATPASLDDSP
jgi:adenylate cyclase